LGLGELESEVREPWDGEGSDWIWKGGRNRGEGIYIYMEGEGDLVRQTRLESVLGFNSNTFNTF